MESDTHFLMDTKALEEEKRLVALVEKQRILNLIENFDSSSFRCYCPTPEPCYRCALSVLADKINRSGPQRRNRARCKVCGDVVESLSVHDFKSCKCGAMSVDGGNEYIRRGYKDFKDVEELP
jgi:uncharacterized CHY-type Zn-finger protein